MENKHFPHRNPPRAHLASHLSLLDDFKDAGMRMCQQLWEFLVQIVPVFKKVDSISPVEFLP